MNVDILQNIINTHVSGIGSIAQKSGPDRFKVTGVKWTSKNVVRCRHAFRQFLCLLSKDRKLKKSFVYLPENVECLPSAVVIMTTADRIHPVFSGRHPKLILIYDHY